MINLPTALDRFYKGQGSEAGETMLFVRPDGTYVSISSGETNQVTLGGQEMFDILRSKKFYLGADVKIIHNHPGGKAEPSLTDLNSLAALRKLGFKGDYMIFEPEKRRLVTVKDKTVKEGWVIEKLRDLQEEVRRRCTDLDAPAPEWAVRRLEMIRQVCLRG